MLAVVLLMSQARLMQARMNLGVLVAFNATRRNRLVSKSCSLTVDGGASEFSTALERDQ